MEYWMGLRDAFSLAKNQKMMYNIREKKIAFRSSQLLNAGCSKYALIISFFSYLILPSKRQFVKRQFVKI